MKRALLTFISFAIALTLAACGGSSDTKNAVTTDAPNSGAPITEAATSAKPESETQTEALALDGVEIDMTEMNSTMVYSQVYDMLMSPDDYLGKTVKMNGAFAVYEGDARNYYACIIADATACCSQGIEFVLDGEHEYPADYPALNDEITVVGVFDSYYEGSNRYVQLIHAKLG